MYMNDLIDIDISIHAPTGGATILKAPTQSAFQISIHAPTGGATALDIQRRACTTNFNPRSHGGSDIKCEKVIGQVKISIHAPTGGATVTPIAASLGITTISIHAPTGGATVRKEVFTAKTSKISIHAPTGGATKLIRQQETRNLFQSTLPRGERRNRNRRQSNSFDFNPRSHGGSDSKSHQI